MGEGCVTVTWLQLNWHLLRLTADMRYADELEQIIYNALLGAESPRDGKVTYFAPLTGIKKYGAVSHGIPGKWLLIKRYWSSSVLAQIEMDMSWQKILGGPFNPGKFALQRGPQVLAVDSQFQNLKNLPEDWQGSQLYRLSIVNHLGKKRRIIFVPFADAGQSGSEYKVMLGQNSPAGK